MIPKKIWRTALLLAAGAAGIWLFAAVLLPLLLPFFIGLAFALAAEKPVRLLQEKTRLPRWLTSSLCVLVLFCLLFLSAFFLFRAIFRELTGFLQQLPQLAAAFAVPLQRLYQQLTELAGRLPDGLGSGLQAGIREIFERGPLPVDKAYEWLFDFASGLLGKAPGIVLFAVTAVLSAFMCSAELPMLRGVLRRRLPEKWQSKGAALLTHLKTTLGGWLKAQLKLMGIVFLIVTSGLMLLNTAYPLLFGVIITVVDALPVLGSGIILVPWGLLQFLQGNVRCGIGFLVLYGVAALTRQALEPRLVGKQAGLPPLITLLALYIGYRTVGIWGMLLFPIGVVFLKQLWDHADLQGNI